MIHSTQKVIKIGTSKAVVLPAKASARDGIEVGDEVEITVRPKARGAAEDQDVIRAAKKILTDYNQDFKNLADR